MDENTKRALQAQTGGPDDHALLPLPEAPHPMQIIAQAVKDGASIETLNGLYELQKRMAADESLRLFNEAKAGWKMVAPEIYKTKKVGYDHKDRQGRTEYKHADLGVEVRVLEKSLAEFGFSLEWKTRQEKGRIFVSCHLSHSAGHTEVETIEGPEDPSGKKNPIQAIGSGIRYLRRYSLEGVLGIAPLDEDDDGAGSGDRPDALSPKKEWRDEYARMIENHSPGLDADDFSDWCKFHNRIRPGQTWKDLAEARAKKMINDWPDFVARVHEWKEAEPE